MKVQPQTLKKLRELINEETTYRSGPQLVSFFNDLGFHDQYGQGFPSRWMYTDAKLESINGTPELDACIRKVFSPIEFVGRLSQLQQFIDAFNQYLAFDGWKVILKNNAITFSKTSIDVIAEIQKAVHVSQEKSDMSDNDFLNREIEEIKFPAHFYDSDLIVILTNRIEEVKKTLNTDAPLATIFLLGSTLEGIFLAVATKFPRDFNSAPCAPKDKDGKVKCFAQWTLNNFIEVAFSLGIIEDDVKKFSHSLRDFRNYIHPYEQNMRNFSPDINTAKICFQVLKAAVLQINRFVSLRRQ